MVLAAALALANPAYAQQAPAPAAALPAPDPARLAAATPVIDQVWPIGTYARVMKASMDQVMSGGLARIMGMRPSDLGLPGKEGAGNRTLSDAARAQDPAFDQRMGIVMRVMGEEIGALMTTVEPQVRSALAIAYARRFTVAELGELQRFFATPTGRIYAAESMTLMTSPEMVDAIMQATPRLIGAMPAIMARVEDATKHLPPVKKDPAK